MTSAWDSSRCPRILLRVMGEKHHRYAGKEAEVISRTGVEILYNFCLSPHTPTAVPGLLWPVSLALFIFRKKCILGEEVKRENWNFSSEQYRYHCPRSLSLYSLPDRVSEPCCLSLQSVSCVAMSAHCSSLHLSPCPLFLRLHRMLWTMVNLVLCAVIAAKHTCALS